eukprot:c2534_g1_i1.p1 GENE.c2534_g1_i1~~c2534_g1_i1.p1  ORF type:complete len:460 (+),score=81.86 c2534_g1_i1:27-1406(+)
MKPAQTHVFVMTYITSLVVVVAQKCFSLAKSSVADDMKLDANSLSEIDFAFFIFFFLGQLATHGAGDLVPPNFLLPLYVIISGFALFSFGVISHFNGLVITWAVHGLAQAAVIPQCFKTISGFFPEEELLGTLDTWKFNQQIGAFAGTLFLTVMSEAFGWRHSFLAVFGIICSLAMMLCLFFPSLDDYNFQHPTDQLQVEGEDGELSDDNQQSQPEPPSVPQPPAIDTPTSTADPIAIAPTEESVIHQQKTLISPPNIRRILQFPDILLCISLICCRMSLTMCVLWFPYFINSHLRVTTPVSGCLFSLFDLFALIGVFYTSRYLANCSVTQCTTMGVKLFISCIVLLVMLMVIGDWAVGGVAVVAVLGGTVSATNFVVENCLTKRLLLEGGDVNDYVIAWLSVVNTICSFGALLQAGLVSFFVGTQVWWPLLIGEQVLVLFIGAILFWRSRHIVKAKSS